MMTLEEFQEKCNKNSCSRRTFISKICKQEHKQKACYNKWLSKQNIPFEVDEKQKQFIKACWIYNLGFYEEKSNYTNWKDYCMLWNILNKEEKDYIIINFRENLFLNQNLDCAHIEGKGNNPKEKYNIENIVIIGRYFHRLIDDYKDPVTQENISGEQRDNWFKRIKNETFK